MSKNRFLKKAGKNVAASTVALAVLAGASAVGVTAGLLEISSYSVSAASVSDETSSQSTYGDFEYSYNSDGTIRITDYKGSDQTVNIPSKINGATVTTIGKDAFYYCSQTNYISIPDTVTTIEQQAFKQNRGLKNITIPASVTSIGTEAFVECSNLEVISVNSKNPNYSSVNGVLFDKSQKTLFAYPCKKADKSYTVPSTVTKINRFAFSENKIIEKITFSSNLQELAKKSLQGCTKLTSIEIPKNVSKLGDAFTSGCVNLEKITVQGGNNYFTAVDGILYDKNKTILYRYPCAKSGDSFTIPNTVKTLQPEAFETVRYLKTITVPGNVKKIDRDVFYHSGMSTINLEEGIETIGTTAFQDCHYIESLVIPSTVKELGWHAVGNCSRLKSVNLKCKVEELSSTFSSCGALEKVNIPNGVKTLSGTFSSCESLTGITIPSSVTEIGSSTFSGSGIKSVEIPSSVTCIGAYAFSRCENLESINLPLGLTKIEMYAFSGCKNLKGKIFTSANVTEIGEGAFQNCSSITEVVFSRINLILKSKAFVNCTNLKKVYLPKGLRIEDGIITTGGAVTYSYFNILTGSVTLPSAHIPVGSSVTATALKEGGYGTVQYQFKYKKSDDVKWTIGAKGTVKTFNVKPSSSGNYTVFVTMSDDTGREITRTANLFVYDPLECTASGSSDLVEIGDKLKVTGSAKGGSGSYKYEVYYKRNKETEWTKAQDYSANSEIYIAPPETGIYNVRIRVKDSNDLVAEKTFNFRSRRKLANNTSIPSSMFLGDTFDINMSASDGAGVYQYAVYYKKSGTTNTVTLRDYGYSSTVQFKPDSAVPYYIYTKVKDQEGTVVEKDFTIAVNEQLVNNSVINSNSIFLGDSVNVTASASGGSGKYTYAVYYKKTSESQWTTLQTYGTNTSVSVKLPESDTYTVRVKVKDSSGDVNSKDFKVTVINSLTNTTSAASSINLGETLKLTASAEGGTGKYQYAMLYKRAADSKLLTLRDYSDDPNFSLKPLAAVTYDICIRVKDSNGTVAEKNFKLSVKNTLKNNSKISAESITLGSTVQVTASASGGSGKYTYAVYYKKTTDKNWVTKQDFSSNTTVSIKPAMSASYDVRVDVKDSNGIVTKKSFTVNVAKALVNNSKISATSVNLGSTVKVTAAASGGSGKYTYAVYYKKTTDKKWVTAQDFKNSDTVSIKPAKAASYDVCVKVKDSNGAVTKKYFTFKSVSNLANNSKLSATTVTLGNTIKVTASASGGSGKYTYAVYYKKTTDKKWVTAQGFKTNNTVSVKPAKATSYNICVKVKDSSGAVVNKYFTVTVK